MSNTYGASRGKSGAGVGGALSEDARKALNAAFDAMSEWREDMAASYDKNSNRVFDNMAAAAKTMGWPADFVDAARQQMQQMSKLQLTMVDQVMDVWEQQMKSPAGGFSLPNAMMDTLKGFPGMGQMPGMGMGMMGMGAGMPQFPGMPDFSSMSGFGAANPLQFWMQAAEMWQKSWSDALKTWTDMQSQAMDKAASGKGPFGPR